MSLNPITFRLINAYVKQHAKNINFVVSSREIDGLSEKILSDFHNKLRNRDFYMSYWLSLRDKIKA